MLSYLLDQPPPLPARPKEILTPLQQNTNLSDCRDIKIRFTPPAYQRIKLATFIYHLFNHSPLSFLSRSKKKKLRKEQAD